MEKKDVETSPNVNIVRSNETDGTSEPANDTGGGVKVFDVSIPQRQRQGSWTMVAEVSNTAVAPSPTRETTARPSSLIAGATEHVFSEYTLEDYKRDLRELLDPRAPGIDIDSHSPDPDC